MTFDSIFFTFGLDMFNFSKFKESFSWSDLDFFGCFLI